MIEIREYLSAEGHSPFRRWFDRLDARAAARITVALVRIEQGNLASSKSIGHGVLEYRIDFGPGYRIYFGRASQTLVILLAGGSKSRQQRDIVAAQARWTDYKTRRGQET